MPSPILCLREVPLSARPCPSGCVSLAMALACILEKFEQGVVFLTAAFGTRVSVVKDIEPQFPALGALSAGNQQNSIEKRIVELEKKIYDIKMKKYLAQQNNR